MAGTRLPKRQLGHSGLQVSEVGLGCWQLGGDFGELSDDTAAAILNRALDEGIRFFDTADVYGSGQSERFLGQYTAHQHDVVIATKYGRAQSVYPDGYSFNSMRESVLRSQDRLERDRLDLLQLHCVPSDILAQRHIFDWLEELKLEGLISHYGASVETLDEARLCLQHSQVTSLQLIFNLFRQDAVDELFDQASENEVGIIARVPLASGLLSGKFSADSEFAKDDHRRFNRDGEQFNVGETFSGLPLAKGAELASALGSQYKPDDMLLAQLALRWILDHPAVSSVIPGASKADQVSQNVQVASLEPLDKSLHQQLADFYQQQVKPHIRGQI